MTRSPCINDQSKQPESRRKYRVNRHCKLSSDNTLVSNDTSETKCFYGDGLVIKMESNHRALEITGDDCTIILSKNSGNIQVIGDNCSIRVDNNLGDIQYTGDGGKILLGSSNSSMGRIKFVGDGGQIVYDVARDVSPSSLGRHNTKCQIEHWNVDYNDRTNNNSKRCLKNQRNIVSSHVQRDEDKDIRKTLKCKEFNGHYSDERTLQLDQEYLDNIMVNDVMEKTQGIYKKHDTKCRGSSVIVGKAVAAKVTTKIETDGECIVKMCSDDFSTNTAKSFDDHPKKRILMKNSTVTIT